MAVLFSESFTGTNGSAPGHLVLGKNPGSGGGVTVQSNRCDFATATSVYDSLPGVSRAISVNGSSALQQTNWEMSGSFVYGSANSYFLVVLRSSVADFVGDPSTPTGGYAFYFELPSATIGINRLDGASGPLASTYCSFTVGTTYYWKVRAVASTLQLFIGTGSMPTTPALSVTDTAYSTGYGCIVLNPVRTSETGSNHIYIDDLVVTDGTGNSLKVLTGSVLASGLPVKAIGTRKLAAAVTATGTKRGVPFKPMYGVSQPTGAMLQIRRLVLSGLVMVSARRVALAQYVRVFAATISTTNITRKFPLKFPAGSVSVVNPPKPKTVRLRPKASLKPAGVTLAAFSRRVFGRAGTAEVTLEPETDVEISMFLRHRAYVTVEVVGTVNESR